MPTQTPEKGKLFTSTPRSVLLGVLVGVLAFTILTGAIHRTDRCSYRDTVNFQAKLMTNTGPIAPDGNYNVEFNLYSASSGGSAMWTEDLAEQCQPRYSGSSTAT